MSERQISRRVKKISDMCMWFLLKGSCFTASAIAGKVVSWWE